jgi:hypothetical protein
MIIPIEIFSIIVEYLVFDIEYNRKPCQNLAFIQILRTCKSCKKILYELYKTRKVFIVLGATANLRFCVIQEPNSYMLIDRGPFRYRFQKEKLFGEQGLFETLFCKKSDRFVCLLANSLFEFMDIKLYDFYIQFGGNIVHDCAKLKSSIWETSNREYVSLLKDFERLFKN